MPSVKYLQLILMNLTVVGLSSSEGGDMWRWMGFAGLLSETPSCVEKNTLAIAIDPTMSI